MRFLLEHIEGRPLTEREFRKNKWYSLSLSDLKRDPELAGEFYELIKTAYAPIGGHVKIRSGKDILGGEAQLFQAVDLDDDPDVDAITFAKKKPAGIKTTGMGHDGSRKAKNAALSHMADRLKTKVYAEVSDAMAHIMLTRYGLEPIEDAEKVQKVLGPSRPIEWVGAHPSGKYKGKNGWYYRKIGGSRHLKTMIGKVKA
jgi:hypothetical protein